MKLLALLSTLLFVAWGTTRIVRWYHLERDCLGHLKRAADSNTVDRAKKELSVVVQYLDDEAITSGTTAIVFFTPDKDIGFWYGNLKDSLGELEKVKADTPQLERTNVLMKLRETLLDHTSEGDSVTCPVGLSVWPHNLLFALWAWLSGLLFVVSVGYWLIRAARSAKRS